MNESISLDDMRLVGALAAASNFTEAGRALGLPKQTVARRVARLEEGLGVRLAQRSTRAFRLTALGRAYAERCAELARSADEINRAVRGEATDVAGTLRVTADPLFGEIFLPALIARFAEEHPAVRVDAVLTSRTVDLVDEGFDVAFRIGAPPEGSLVATRIADAAMVFVASPAYLARHRRAPRAPEDLAAHDCIALAPEGGAARWAFRAEARGTAAVGKRRAGGVDVRWVAIAPRVRVNHLGLAREAAKSGLGIANLPAFAAAEAIARGELVEVLGDRAAPFGGIFVVSPTRRFVTPRLRAFRELAVRDLGARPELVGAGQARARRARLDARRAAR